MATQFDELSPFMKAASLGLVGPGHPMYGAIKLARRRDEGRYSQPASDPIVDLHAALARSIRSISRWTGPVPVDFTLASAALNRGELPLCGRFVTYAPGCSR